MNKYDDMFKKTIQPFEPIPILILIIAVQLVILLSLINNCGM
jgi:hypothetical protein